MLALVAAVSLTPFRTPIAFLEARQILNMPTLQTVFTQRVFVSESSIFKSKQAAPACEYASSLNCANIFASVSRQMRGGYRDTVCMSRTTTSIQGSYWSKTFVKAEVFGGGKNEGDTLQGSGMLLFVSAP